MFEKKRLFLYNYRYSYYASNCYHLSPQIISCTDWFLMSSDGFKSFQRIQEIAENMSTICTAIGIAKLERKSVGRKSNLPLIET